jgi:glucose/arabinose dehydrogenase
MLTKIFTSVFYISLITTSYSKLGVEQVAKGFDRPIWVGFPTGLPGKIWVVEQGGKIWIVDEKSGRKSSEPFLDIHDLVSRKGNEEGLLGLAFAPDFAKTGRYYVNYTDKTPEKLTQILRFVSEDRKTTDPKSGEILMKYPSEESNHNGGWLGFGPDNMLYIANGDGGSGNDPHKHGQALDTYLGKILRIDVSPKTGYKVPTDNPFVSDKAAKSEIWAYGVRNPWRCSFDRETGDFWIGDVGQNNWEEVNHVSHAKGKGANFGWSLREGDKKTPKEGTGGPLPKVAIDPVYVYNHGNEENEGLSVTGGYVYHGSISELEGRYVFGDYQNPRIWSFVLRNGKASDFKDHTKELQPEDGRITLISSFAENQDGELYVVDLTGSIYRIVGR